MNANAQHLPNGFNVDGYRITGLLTTGENYFLYQAVSPSGDEVELREFCPQNLAVRDPESQKIRYRDPDPAHIQTLKARFDADFKADSTDELYTLGTSYLVIKRHKTQTGDDIPQIATRRKNPRRKSAASEIKPIKLPPRTATAPGKGRALVVPAIVVAAIGLIGFLVYQLTKDHEEIPPVVSITPDIPKPKKVEPPPVVVIPEPEPEPEPVVVVEPEPEPEPEPVDTSYKPSRDLLAIRREITEKFTANEGKITPELQKAYVEYAEKAVREYVTTQGGQFSQAFEDWLQKTNLSPQIFASFYPPDPNVATNADILVNELKERAYTYDQLLLAFAVGRRTYGLGAISGSANNVDQPCDLFIKGKPPVNHFGNEPNQVDEQVYFKVRDYLKRRGLTPKKAWINKKSTLAALEEYGVNNKNLLRYLHEDMYRNGQMRRKRDPNPSAIDFFNYLVDKYEQIGKMRDVDRKKVEWDGVMLDCTPWLAMLHLSDTRPIRECEAIWDRYLGKMGSKRLWRYGPYRRDDDPEPPALFSLDPSPEWSMQSNEKFLHIGGMCGTMANIACTSRIALGSPAIFSTQPGHANLMYHVYNASGSRIVIDQSVDTTKVTAGYWLLNDTRGTAKRPAVYHIGLALSLNLDEEAWLASQQALNVYKLVYDKNNETSTSDIFRNNALKSVLAINPFHTEAWFTLFDQRGKDLFAAIDTIDDLRQSVHNGRRATCHWKRKKYNRKLGRPGRDHQKVLDAEAAKYADTMNASMIDTALKGSPPELTKNQWQKVLTWMRKEAGDNSYPDVQQAYKIAEVQSKGTKNMVKDVDREFTKILNHFKSRSKRKRELKTDPDQVAIMINAVMLSMPEKDALPWITKFVNECPEMLRFKPKPGRRADITEFYKCVTDHYMNLVDDSEARNFRDLLKKQHSEYIVSVHGNAPADA